MITHRLPAALLVDGDTFAAPRLVLTWDRATPAQVSMRLVDAVWRFDVGLLADGLNGPTGIGDVFVCPVPDTPLVDIVLDNGTNRAAAQVHHDDLADFVTDVQRIARGVQA